MSIKFTVINADQRSDEWRQSRCGRLTGSKAYTITAKGKGSAESIQRRDYRLVLACERLTGVPQDDGFCTPEMTRGLDLEPIAFAAYEAATGNMVRSTGFLSGDEHMVGCSLDGDIDNFDGIIELKCPKSATHLGYLKNPKSLIDAYLPQVIHNLWVSGAKYCDLVSFDDRLPKALRLCRTTIVWDINALRPYEEAALAFLAEVDAEVAALQALAA